jgi:glycosyltransferase involved in cell wall biosynthesis
VASNISRIITVSNYEKAQVSKHLNISPDRISVTHLAPNPVFTKANRLEREAWRRELCRQNSAFGKFILGVGYEQRKNIPLLIKTYARVVPYHSDLNLVLVSAEEHNRYQFERLAIEMGLAGRVIVLGPLPPEQLAMLYSLAEMFIFPSERESFGLPPLEAMACGTPVIAMNATSVPEIVQDGALLVNGNDPPIWSDAIRRLMSDETLRERLISHGLARASQLTWRKCAQGTVEIYRHVLQA